MTRRAPKKTDSVEIRLSPEVKAAFMARCRARGLTASDALRRFIDAETGKAARPTVIGWRALIVAIAGSLALGAVAAPSLAEVKTPGRAMFDRLDRDGDGALTFEEYRSR